MTLTSQTKKWVILAGGFRLPDHSASAIRVVGVAKLLQSIGYEPLILGKFDKLPEKPDDSHLIDVNGIQGRDIRKPFPDFVPCNYVSDGSSINEVVQRLGAPNVSVVLLYNYPSLGLLHVMRACAKSSVSLGLELTEWYGWEGRKIARNVLRIVDSELRMRLLSRKIGNIICTSSWLAQRLKAQNTFVLPFVVDVSEDRWAKRRGRPPLRRGGRTFIYSGSPGIGMHKDLLPLIVQAFYTLGAARRDFIFHVYGITRQQFLIEVPEQQEALRRLGACVQFHGRVDHETALDALSGACFSIFLRKPNRNSNAGFPTKYMEAAALGVPVISNLTSDIENFLEHRQNGIVVNDNNEHEMFMALKTAMDLDLKVYDDMRKRQLASNPFAIQCWRVQAERFMRSLK